MKLQIMSDLHLEFAPIEINNAGADILILAGDILVASLFNVSEASPYFEKAQEWLLWMEKTCSKFQRVIYILGNHEHYKSGKFYETYDVLKNAFKHIHNLEILDQTWVDIGQYRFIGGTLWTDFGKDNLQAMFVRDGLNDYNQIIGKQYKKLTTNETAFYHTQFLHQIDTQYQTDKKIIIVGHHAPSYRSVHEQYRYGRAASLNRGYYSDLDLFIEDRPNIKLWIHGHMHNSFDYIIGQTRIVCNPRGYQRENNLPENRDFNPNFIVEV